MKKKRNIRGFTMAELLIVVAVITVLSGVGFIAVQAHQKNVAQVEANTIAKEIFFAAQNHLTMAESQGYLNPGTIAYGTSEGAKKADEPANAEIYYFAVPTHSFTGTNSSVLDMMLPFGSIDDTIRLSGNYVIRYQANPARVLDVWYGRASNQQYTGKYDANPISLGIAKLLTEAANEKPNYGAVIGYYGGDAALENGVTLNAPTITVNNAERLTVTVDTTLVNKKGTETILASKDGTVSVKLIITGETSKAMAAIPLLPSPNGRATQNVSGVFDVTLDDITKSGGSTADGFHFAELFKGLGSGSAVINTQAGTVCTQFIPGENITVQAVAFSNNALASIAYSNEVTTNSLFADVLDADTAGVKDVSSGKVAVISNIRHLENLDRGVSNVNSINISGTNAFVIKGAKQVADLVWSQTGGSTGGPDAFTAKISSPSIYKIDASSGTTGGCFLPVNVDYALVYEGAPVEGTGGAASRTCHSITGVKVSTSGTDPAGLFGKITSKAEGTVTWAAPGEVTVRNLKLIDFDISATGKVTNAGSAGALAGKAEGTASSQVTFENILAHNTAEFDDAKTAATIQSAGGSAGGLIGYMTETTVQKCAAALVVNASKCAGGLIGEAHGPNTVKASYSAGRTTAKKEGNVVTASEYGKTTPPYNVTGGTKVGGLIGDQENATVEYCYSTCSVSVTGTSETNYAGGLVGFSGKAITNSYAAGLVHAESQKPKIGAFSGNKGSGNYQNCLYFEIINPTETTENGSTTYGYLPPVGDTATVTGITALDASADSYNTFCGAPTTWKNAEPSTASGLIDLYYATVNNDKAAKYNLKTVSQLGADGIQEDATSGESAAPADFVATHYGDWPAPEILVINVASSGGSGGIGF